MPPCVPSGVSCFYERAECRGDVSRRSIGSTYRNDISGTQVRISPGVVRPRTLVPTAAATATGAGAGRCRVHRTPTDFWSDLLSAKRRAEGPAVTRKPRRSGKGGGPLSGTPPPDRFGEGLVERKAGAGGPRRHAQAAPFREGEAAAPPRPQVVPDHGPGGHVGPDRRLRLPLQDDPDPRPQQ